MICEAYIRRPLEIGTQLISEVGTRFVRTHKSIEEEEEGEEGEEDPESQTQITITPTI